MATFSHTINQSYNSPTGTLSTAVVITGDENLESDFTISAGAVNQESDCSVVHSSMQSLFLQFNSTGNATGNITVKTNSSGTAQDTIVLTNNQPQIWYASGPYANPFSNSVTKFYTTDSTTGAVGGVLHVRALNNQ